VKNSTSGAPSPTGPMKRRCTVFPTEDMYGLDILICWWWGGGGGGVLRVGAFFFVLGRSLARYSIYLSVYCFNY